MSKSVIVLNTISIILGVPSMLFAVIMPYLGSFALPTSIISLILSTIAFIKVIKNKQNKIFSIITILIALIATIASIVWIVELQGVGHLL